MASILARAPKPGGSAMPALPKRIGAITNGSESKEDGRDQAWFLREIVPKLNGFSLSENRQGDGFVARSVLALSLGGKGSAPAALEGAHRSRLSAIFVD